MDKVRFEYAGLVTITAIGFSLNLLFGLIGRFAFTPISYQQLLCYQLADVSAITASVIAARYTGLRGEHIAASSFILLGITHGLSLASSGLEDFHVEKGITVVLPMIPSLLLMGCCSLFPLWLRVAAIVPASFLIYVYCNVVSGGTYYSTTLRLGYLSWILLEILWSVYLIKDWRKQRMSGLDS